MKQFCAGFARLDVTPMLGVAISGYYVPRFADDIKDALEINALALSYGETKAVLMTLDNCGVTPTSEFDRVRRHVAEVTGVPFEGVFVSCTHTHTSPEWDENTGDELIEEYRQLLYRKFADAAKLALNDLKPAKFGFAVSEAKNVAFVRRFRMKDGSVQTNPGVGNPDIVAPIGDVDERVNVLRFDRAGADSIVLANFGNHPDVVGGCGISADWPGMTRRKVEKALDDVKCIFFNGAQGDVNHVNVHPSKGFKNDLFPDFDDCDRGYGHARHIANVLTAAVLTVYDKVEYTDADALSYLQKAVPVPSNMPAPEDIPQARRFEELHQAGRDAEIPFKGMMLTTVVAEAERMLRLEHGPAEFHLPLSALRIGGVALIGLPGEPFTGIGRALKEAEGWDLVLPCCITNGYEGYFPMKEAYDEGGYEARSSVYKAGVAEIIIKEGVSLLGELRKKA